MAERHRRVLGELAELGLELARGLKARAEAAETRADAEGLALAFHRVSRSVRLTLALESKLGRERSEVGRYDDWRRRGRVDQRKAQVRAAISRALGGETEGEGDEAVMDELEARLEHEALFDQFLDGPVEACIARLRADLGLPANDAGPPAAATGQTEAGAPRAADWRSSA